MLKNKIKSQKGITMVSLVIYVASFLTVTLLIGYITTFFYNNVDVLNSTAGGAADYNMLCTYIKKECKTVTNYSDLTKHFERKNSIVYYKDSSHVIAIANNVSDFKLEGIDTKRAKLVITINNITYGNIFVID
jgi:hypothetical protein